MNLCVLEERRALPVGNYEKILMSFFFFWLLYQCIPPILAYFFLSSFLCSIVALCSWAYGLAHFWAQWQACNVCARIRHLVCFFPPFLSEAFMYPTALSTCVAPLAQKLGNGSRMKQRTMNACLETMGCCYAVLALGPFYSLLGCKKSSLEKCGCNSVHITLA